MIHPASMTLEEGRDKHVYIGLYFQKKWCPAGVVTYNDGHGYAGFSYFDSYLDQNLPPLNPATLNHRDTGSRHFVVDGAVNAQMLDRTFWELLPTSGDFGHHALVARYPQYQSMHNAQRLNFLGNRTVGGLSAYIKRIQDEVNIDSVDWLDDAQRDAVAFHMQEAVRLRQNGDGFLAMTSYGGVRPKSMYRDGDGKYWIAKFNLPTDPYDMAVAEHVAMNMAKASGMKTPDTKILSLPSGANVFLTERFDRAGSHRRHSLSLFSLAPGIEVGGAGGVRQNTAAVMATIVRRFSDFQDQDSANIVLKFMVDIGFNNVDNHLRNTRVILNDKGLWELSPVFDITFNPRSQPHIYNPTGLPLSENFLTNDAIVDAIAKQTGADVGLIDHARQRVIKTTENWEAFCDAAGMSPQDKIKIQASVNLGLNRVEVEHRIKSDHRKKIDQLLKSHPKPR